MRFLALVVALAVCHPTGVSAFGADGHEAVCEIAYRELSPSAKERVDSLIALETDDRIRTFRESCVWPDFRGPAQRARRPEHYINVPRSWTVIGDRGCHGTDRCLFTAIAHDIAVLSDRESSDGRKLAALKFLGHWVGDIHQPLHVSYEDDRGGNDILVVGVKGCARKGETRLSLPFIPSCLPTTARLSGTDIILSQWIL